MDAETSWRVIEQERLSLADLLAGLTDDQWDAPSLCAGWRIKDVAAHVALAPQPPSPWTMLIEGVRAGGRIHKINHDFSVRYAERPGVDLAGFKSRRPPRLLVLPSGDADQLVVVRLDERHVHADRLSRRWRRRLTYAAAGPRRTSDSTTAAAANSPENTRFMIVCLRGVCSHRSRRADRPV